MGGEGGGRNFLTLPTFGCTPSYTHGGIPTDTAAEMIEFYKSEIKVVVK